MAHILIVEPDTTLGDIYSSALKMEGHTVSHSLNAQDAIHSADERLPNVVLLELELATHNGIEFLYEFRTYVEWQDVPVIIVSHVAPSKEALNPVSWGQFKIAAYHYKPTTTLTNLTASVKRVLAASTVAK